MRATDQRAGRPQVLAGLEPDEAATTVRAPEGEAVITDGPFAETKELLFSFYVVDVPDRDPAAGLALLDPLAEDERLARYAPLHAARADLLRRSGDPAGARAAYARAIETTGNARERAALAKRAAELSP